MEYLKFEHEGVKYTALVVEKTTAGVWVSLVTIKPKMKNREGVKLLIGNK